MSYTRIIMFTAAIFALALFLAPAQGQDSSGLGDYIVSGVRRSVSLDLQDAKLVDVLKMFSQQSGLNFVANEAVKERVVTLYLENAGLKEAMDVLFKANNLSYDYYPEANIFVVKDLGKPVLDSITRIYPLKYARVSSSRLQSEITNGLQPATGGGNASSGSSGGNVKSAIEKVLSEYGKVSEDTMTNSLVVTDVPSQFTVIEKVIAALDKPAPKVMIEVEMLDVSKILIDKIGVQYSSALGGGVSGNFIPGKITTNQPFPDHLLKGANLGNRMALDGQWTPSILDLSSFNAFIQLLSSNSSTKVLARPRILTLSNETAEVNLTVNEAVGIKTDMGTAASGTLSQSIERVETGTKLRVTPQVNPNSNEITLFVEVFTKEARDSGLTVQGLNGTIKNPEERGAKSVLRLVSGETLLMGGLIKETTQNVQSKIPLLGDIPLLGHLFRHDAKTKDQRELLVFLTPRLVEDRPMLAKGGKLFQREQDNPVRSEAISDVLNRISRD